MIQNSEWKQISANTVFVRAGVSNFQRALADGDTLNQKKVWIFQPSLGAGFKVGNVAIDYAFTNLANQSNPLYTNVFSLYIDLVPKGKEKQQRGDFPNCKKLKDQKKKKVTILFHEEIFFDINYLFYLLQCMLRSSIIMNG